MREYRVSSESLNSMFSAMGVADFETMARDDKRKGQERRNNMKRDKPRDYGF